MSHLASSAPQLRLIPSSPPPPPPPASGHNICHPPHPTADHCRAQTATSPDEGEGSLSHPPPLSVVDPLLLSLNGPCAVVDDTTTDNNATSTNSSILSAAATNALLAATTHGRTSSLSHSDRDRDALLADLSSGSPTVSSGVHSIVQILPYSDIGGNISAPAPHPAANRKKRLSSPTSNSSQQLGSADPPRSEEDLLNIDQSHNLASQTISSSAILGEADYGPQKVSNVTEENGGSKKQAASGSGSSGLESANSSNRLSFFSANAIAASRSSSDRRPSNEPEKAPLPPTAACAPKHEGPTMFPLPHQPRLAARVTTHQEEGRRPPSLQLPVGSGDDNQQKRQQKDHQLSSNESNTPSRPIPALFSVLPVANDTSSPPKRVVMASSGVLSQAMSSRSSQMNGKDQLDADGTPTTHPALLAHPQRVLHFFHDSLSAPTTASAGGTITTSSSQDMPPLASSGKTSFTLSAGTTASLNAMFDVIGHHQQHSIQSLSEALTQSTSSTAGVTTKEHTAEEEADNFSRTQTNSGDDQLPKEAFYAPKAAAASQHRRFFHSVTGTTHSFVDPISINESQEGSPLQRHQPPHRHRPLSNTLSTTLNLSGGGSAAARPMLSFSVFTAADDGSFENVSDPTPLIPEITSPGNEQKSSINTTTSSSSSPQRSVRVGGFSSRSTRDSSDDARGGGVSQHSFLKKEDSSDRQPHCPFPPPLDDGSPSTAAGCARHVMGGRNEKLLFSVSSPTEIQQHLQRPHVHSMFFNTPRMENQEEASAAAAATNQRINAKSSTSDTVNNSGSAFTLDRLDDDSGCSRGDDERNVSFNAAATTST